MNHITKSVKTALAKENTNLSVIPRRLTSILQPLDVFLNEPFKDGVRKRWMEWLLEGIHKFTANGRQKKPSFFDRRSMAGYSRRNDEVFIFEMRNHQQS